jgi:hypothetical protein
VPSLYLTHTAQEHQLNTRQAKIVRVAAVLIFFLNAFYAAGLNYITNSVQHDIGRSVVSVFEPHSDSQALVVPIQRTPSFDETGKSVSVYLKNGYCAGEGFARPTVILLLFFGTLYFLAGVQRPRGKTTD